MKKVGLMTWYDNNNYGTALQAFALQTIINNYADCEIIHYKSKHPGYGIKDITNPVLRNNLLWKIYERTFMKIYSKLYLQPEQERRQCMLKFFYNKLKIAANTGDEDLSSVVNRQYDAVVCGSDQIWNPTRYDKHFFLDYVSNEIPKIAYAPSFGVSKILDKSTSEEIQELLSKFDYLSVRESAGQKIIFDLIQKEVPVCLDPTLLHDRSFWDNLANESEINLPKKYAYSYLLGRNKSHYKKSETIAHNLGLELVQQPYHTSDYLTKCKKIPPSGPVDFINAIRNSEFVCTDSFHGVIFAIVFEKPFVVFRRFKRNNNSSQNSRVDTLLKIVGLEERLELDSSLPNEILMKVNFDESKRKLSLHRDESIKYLSDALKNSLYRED